MKKLFVSLLAVALGCAAKADNTVTLDFTDWGFAGADAWTSTYEAHTVEFDHATVTFTKADRQPEGNAIDNCPVTKGFDITVTADQTIASTSVALKQWNTKSKTAEIWVNDAQVAQTSDFAFTDVTINAESYTIKFTETSNQVGLECITLTLTDGEPEVVPVLTTDLDNIYFWNYTTTAWSDYQVNEQTIHINAQNLTENVSYYMLSSGKTNGSYLENNVRFTVGNKNQYETNSGNIFVRVTSKVMGTYEDVLVVKSGDLIVEVPVCLKVAGTEGDGYWDANDFCPLTVADANLIHAVIPAGHSYMTEPTHAFAQDDNGERFFKGVVAEVTEISAKQEDGTGYGNATFVLKDELTAEETLTVFRAKGFDNALITDSEILKEGDTVVVTGDICDYNGTTELKSCYLYSVEPGTTTAISTVSAPVSEAHYNLQGQRVEGQHGFSVKAGKVIYTK